MYLEIVEKIEQSGEAAPSHENVLAASRSPGIFPEEAGPLLAVKIVNSIIGGFWFCLSDTEPFDPGDGLPVYRPSEIKALNGKGYGPQDLLAVHRTKAIFEGRVVR